MAPHGWHYVEPHTLNLDQLMLLKRIAKEHRQPFLYFTTTTGKPYYLIGLREPPPLLVTT